MMKITLQGYTPGTPETLTNFPVLIAFSANADGSGFDYGTFQSAQGNDLRFWSGAPLTGTELKYEIEEWNTSGTSYVWVRVPALVDNTTNPFGSFVPSFVILVMVANIPSNVGILSPTRVTNPDSRFPKSD